MREWGVVIARFSCNGAGGWGVADDGSCGNGGRGRGGVKSSLRLRKNLEIFGF